MRNEGLDWGLELDCELAFAFSVRRSGCAKVH